MVARWPQSMFPARRHDPIKDILSEFRSNQQLPPRRFFVTGIQFHLAIMQDTLANPARRLLLPMWSVHFVVQSQDLTAVCPEISRIVLQRVKPVHIHFAQIKRHRTLYNPLGQGSTGTRVKLNPLRVVSCRNEKI